MGKGISAKHEKDRMFYMLNIPYMDYFILRTMLDGIKGEQFGEYEITKIKAYFEEKHKWQPTNSLWSQALSRLRQRGYIDTDRRECIYIRFSSPHIKLQINKALYELKQLDKLIQERILTRQVSEG